LRTSAQRKQLRLVLTLNDTIINELRQLAAYNHFHNGGNH
jgi:hypothetical protein